MIIFVIFALLIGIPILAAIAKWLLIFNEELEYLKNQIRKTEGREKRYWIRKRRKLWMSIFPFVKY